VSGDDGSYEFSDGLGINPIPVGSTVFVTGERFSPASELARSMVLDGASIGDGSVFITTNDSARTLYDRCREDQRDLAPSQLGILDCTGQDIGEQITDVRTKYVSTQSDLTGIGMKFSALYESLYNVARDGQIRVGLFNLSSLVMYVDLRTLFRFAQTLAGRIESAGGVGVFRIDPEAHDEQTLSTLSQVADGMIEVSEAAPDSTTTQHGQVRVRGLRDQPTGWRPFRFPARADE